MTTTLLVPSPKEFSFRRTVRSNGWCVLRPFEFDESTWTLTRVLDVGSAAPLTVSITGAASGVQVATSKAKLGKRVIEKVTRDVRHIFRLDDDMNGFYSVMSGEPDYSWIARAGAGRMLRSPTVFEDLVKTICTTNCSWALTTKMVTELTNSLGRPASDGRRAFPTPQAMAEAPVGFFRDVMRSGYRAPYFKELAERVAAGELDVEGWMNSDLPTDELKRQMKSVKGVGDYAAENLLKLVGRYDGLALDSWLRAQFAKTHNKGRACKDAKIERYYKRFNSWKGLALWCDMTRDWIDDSLAV
jgi:N-glycosylase/DNA lyase